MSHQLTFADSEFSSKRRQTRKEIFLSRMEQILPWQNMVEVIEPFYPKAGNGRRPYPLETMLRIHCMQHWYNLSDGAMEDALYEIASMRLFARLSLDSALPDRTTIMNFRHLLEQHQLCLLYTSLRIYSCYRKGKISAVCGREFKRCFRTGKSVSPATTF